MEQTYFRRGFGLKKEVEPILESEYHSNLVEEIRAQDYTATFGDVTVRMARQFGFCYGVDRAVDYAYETAHKFPDRRIFLLGEIIHNPFVNRRMSEKGIRFIHPGEDGAFDFSGLTPDDVVILPAFGATLKDFKRLQETGSILVDTTCGSVLVVWKRVDQYARDGFTALVHGKAYHEETRATVSQTQNHEGGRYIIVRDMAEARLVCDYIEQAPEALGRDAFLEHFREKVTPGFDPDADLQRIGVANQTTMLAGDSLAIAAEVKKSLVRRYGDASIDEHFRSFDTICSATQERQDAVKDMMQSPPDVMLVIGGYNSSNTNHLAHMCRQYTRTFHIADSDRIDPAANRIRHKPDLPADTPEETTDGWLPDGPFSIGVTAGASTPNNKIGEAVARVLETRRG